jgi:hypothetical protein
MLALISKIPSHKNLHQLFAVRRISANDIFDLRLGVNRLNTTYIRCEFPFFRRRFERDNFEK